MDSMFYKYYSNTFDRLTLSNVILHVTRDRHIAYLIKKYDDLQLIWHSHWRSCDLRKIMLVSTCDFHCFVLKLSCKNDREK